MLDLLVVDRWFLKTCSYKLGMDEKKILPSLQFLPARNILVMGKNWSAQKPIISLRGYFTVKLMELLTDNDYLLQDCQLGIATEDVTFIDVLVIAKNLPSFTKEFYSKVTYFRIPGSFTSNYIGNEVQKLGVKIQDVMEGQRDDRIWIIDFRRPVEELLKIQITPKIPVCFELKEPWCSKILKLLRKELSPRLKELQETEQFYPVPLMRFRRSFKFCYREIKKILGVINY